MICQFPDATKTQMFYLYTNTVSFKCKNVAAFIHFQITKMHCNVQGKGSRHWGNFVDRRLLEYLININMLRVSYL